MPRKLSSGSCSLHRGCYRTMPFGAAALLKDSRLKDAVDSTRLMTRDFDAQFEAQARMIEAFPGRILPPGEFGLSS